MPSTVVKSKLESAERRVAFVAAQLTGVMATELSEALKEIRDCVRILVPTERTAAGCTVLFVDDEEIIRRIGTQILSREGYEVLTASNGIDALGVFEQNRDAIKCIILDLVMPRMDGLQTFRHLRRSSPDVDIILTTGYGEEEIKKRFGNLELQGFLRKPFSASSLTKMVGEVIGKTGEKG
jgi:CheY-like chemotaxis protein